MRRPPAWLLVAFVLAARCGTSDAQRPDGSTPDVLPDTSDAASDAALDLEAGRLDADTTPPDLAAESVADTPVDPGSPDLDAAPDPSLSCLTLPKLDVAFDLLPGEPLTQIHAALGFDGEAVWIAYNVPDPLSSDFDVRLARLWCDGTYAKAPVRAHVGALGNDIDPDLAIGPSSVLIVWATDTGGDPNMVLHARGYTLDGKPTAADAVRLEPAVDGVATPASAWLPKVAALPDGTFAVVGAWADPSATRFQVFLALLDAKGALLPPRDAAAPGLVRLDPEPAIDQTYPDVIARDDGTIVVAWTRSVSDTEYGVRTVQVAPDGTIGAVQAVAEGVTDGAALGIGAGQGATPWLAWYRADGANAIVDLARVGDPPGSAASFGEGWAFDHSPILAPTAWGGAILWYRVRNGMWNDVLLQGFDGSGAGAVPEGQAVLVNPVEGDVDHATPAVYGPALTHIRDRVFLAAWSEGDNPDFTVVGRFVKLP